MNFKRIAYIVVSVLVIQATTLATDKRYLDSCENIVRTTSDLSKKVYALYILSYENGLIHPRKGISYGYQCLQLAEQMQYLLGQVNAYNGIGNSYETMANYDSARYFHERSYYIAKKLGRERSVVACLFNIATCYKEQGMYREALTIYLEAYKLVENKEEYNPRIHYYLGEIYYLLSNYDLAMQHASIGYEKCMKFDFEYVAYNMMVVKARCKIKTGKLDSALVILDQARTKLKGYTDQYSYAYCLHALADCYILKNDFDKAIVILKEELLVQESIKNQNGICLANLNLAYCVSKGRIKNDKMAMLYLSKAEEKIAAIEHNKDVLMNAYQRIASIYELLGQVKPSLTYFKLYSELKDELLNKDQYAQLHELQTKYETAKKEKQITDQKAILEKHEIVFERNRLQIILLLCAIAFLILFGLFFYNRYKLKQKLRLMLEIQKQEQLRENALKEKENEERTRMAKDIHDELGSGLSKIKLISELIKKDDLGNTTLDEKINSISDTSGKLVENMRDLIWIWNPENTNLANLIARIREYTYDYLEDFPIELKIISPEHIPQITVSNDVSRNIYMIVKEALQNIVKHAHASTVQLTVKLNGVLQVSIEDNGSGFDHSKVTKGNGLNNLYSRSKLIGADIKIDSELGKGSTLLLFIPIDKLKEKKIPL